MSFNQAGQRVGMQVNAGGDAAQHTLYLFGKELYDAARFSDWGEIRDALEVVVHQSADGKIAANLGVIAQAILDGLLDQSTLGREANG